MKSIGGYFSLELSSGEHFHKNGIMLNTARNCLEYILLSKQYKKIYIPFYTCEVLLEPLKKHKIIYQFYHINKFLEPVETFDLSAHQAFLYTNYFGVKNDAVERLANLYGKQLIVDNAQAFFSKPLNGIDIFYSPRKFFGVSDGGILFTDKLLTADFEHDISFNRMSHLLKRIDSSAEDAYCDFKQNDNSLNNNPIKKISKLTDNLLRSIDYKKVRKIRTENFFILDLALRKSNLLNINFSNIDYAPMVYPFWAKDETLRKKLINNKIYVATYWNNVFEWCKETDLDYIIAKNIIPLPIDQRYNNEDMQQIINLIV